MHTGDKVSWTHSSKRGRVISMTRRDGVIVSIENGMAVVKLKNNKITQVPVDLLRTPEEETEIMDFLDKMRERYW